MKTLDRSQLDELLREVEPGAYGLALELVRDREKAADLLVEVFSLNAPVFPRRSASDVKRRLAGAIRKASRTDDGFLAEADGTVAVPVPERLHTQLVDVVEEHQQDEPLGAKKRFLAAGGGVVVVALFAGFLFVRWSALEAAQPTVQESNPTANATEIPIQGNVWLRFGKSPSGKPSIALEPRDGTLEAADWDGHTVLVGYGGLHLARSYTMTVTADYKSKYGDVGHFVRHFTFRTEGYPVIVKLDPPDGGTAVFRHGQLQITFNHRPPVDPVLTIDKAGTTLASGQWNSATWQVDYSELSPLTTYQVSIAVDYHVAKANIKRTWSFTSEVGPPPPGVPVIWYSTSVPDYGSNTPQRFVALDWSGRPVGTSYQVGIVRQTWDGATLGGQNGVFYDTNGNPETATPLYGTVADDSRTACVVAAPNGETRGGPFPLIVGSIRGPLRPVTQLQSASGGYVSLLACSVSQNRAIITEAQVTGIVSLRLLSLSSGRLLYQHSYTGPGFNNMIPSRDCRYVAEEHSSVDANGQPAGESTFIRRTADGAILAHLLNRRIVAFSWDDSRVVTVPEDETTPNEVEVINWQTGSVIWRRSLGQAFNGKQLVFAAAQPNGSDMAIAVATASQGGGEADELWFVNKDGAAIEALNSSFYSPFFVSF